MSVHYKPLIMMVLLVFPVQMNLISHHRSVQNPLHQTSNTHQIFTFTYKIKTNKLIQMQPTYWEVNPSILLLLIAIQHIPIMMVLLVSIALLLSIYSMFLPKDVLYVILINFTIPLLEHAILDLSSIYLKMIKIF